MSLKFRAITGFNVKFINPWIYLLIRRCEIINIKQLIAAPAMKMQFIYVKIQSWNICIPFPQIFSFPRKVLMNYSYHKTKSLEHKTFFELLLQYNITAPLYWFSGGSFDPRHVFKESDGIPLVIRQIHCHSHSLICAQSFHPRKTQRKSKHAQTKCK